MRKKQKIGEMKKKQEENIGSEQLDPRAMFIPLIHNQIVMQQHLKFW